MLYIRDGYKNHYLSTYYSTPCDQGINTKQGVSFQ